MVLMPMRQHDAEQIRGAIFDKFQIRQNQLGAWIVRTAKGDTKVNHDPFASAAIKIDIHANLVRPAKREEKQFVTRFCHAPPSRFA